MYRSYVTNHLTPRELIEANKSAPDNHTWCNFLCQKYLPSEDFYGDRRICKECVSVWTRIKNGGTVNAEPQDNDKLDVMPLASTRACVMCKQTKGVLEFDSNRIVCKFCRHNYGKDRNAERVDKFLADIETLKSDPELLRRLVVSIPKDCLVIVINHYKITRLAADTKEVMVANVCDYFRNLNSPYTCTCGKKVFRIGELCRICLKNKDKPTTEEFKDRLVDIIADLRVIKINDFTIKQLQMIADKMGCAYKEYHNVKKEPLIKMMNALLVKRRDSIDTELCPPAKLNLNGIVVASREDGFINASQLCKAGGKQFSDWSRLESTKKILKLLSESVKMDPCKLIETQRGGYHRDSWIHPRLATHIGQWISIDFSVKVTEWVDEWRKQHAINDNKYMAELNRIKPDENAQKEKAIQARLHEETGGEIEVETPFGFIDLLTDTELVEIKIGSNWKSGLGQLCAYSKFYPSHQRRLHLFDATENNDIISLCKDYGIIVTYE